MKMEVLNIPTISISRHKNCISEIESLVDKIVYCRKQLKMLKYEKGVLLCEMNEDIFPTQEEFYILGRIEFVIKYLERQELSFETNDLED